MKYYLVDNHLTTEDKTDLRAEIVVGKKRSQEDIIQQIVHRSVGLTYSQVSSVFKENQAAIKMYLAEGDTVEMDMYTIQPRIRGVFNSPNESFDRNKHEVYIKVRPTGSLKAVADRISVERVTVAKTAPQPEVCQDMEAGTVNDTLTLDESARVNGSNLKFDKEDPKQGVFLIDSKGKETKMAKFTDILPKQLTFRVPKSLPKDTYTLEVRSTLGTKELRVGKLSRSLTVK